MTNGHSYYYGTAGSVSDWLIKKKPEYKELSEPTAVRFLQTYHLLKIFMTFPRVLKRVHANKGALKFKLS